MLLLSSFLFVPPRIWLTLLLSGCLLALQAHALGQPSSPALTFVVSMPEPATHIYQVTLQLEGIKVEQLELKMPVLTPGYYRLINNAQYVNHFQVTDAGGKPLKWAKTAPSCWTVQTHQTAVVTVAYSVKATRNVAEGLFLDENRGYITPAALCLYPVGYLQTPITIRLNPYIKWGPLIATGLDSLSGQPYTFVAPDYEVLYDSPLLMGHLEQLPPFVVQGISHYFIGYDLGNFDRIQFVANLKQMVATTAAIFGDIPYKHYTFLSIGPAAVGKGGGIEHANSTAITFSGDRLKTRQGQQGLYNFLTHEYFHLYNVKRIRPVELQPFRYDQENRTKLLWISEGFTTYYPYLILNKIGVMTQEEVFTSLQKDIASYENKPGHLFQSATQASYTTWENDPFKPAGEEAYKLISYYDKGAVLGALLDVKIRHETGNKKSLDDVMRALYRDFYLDEKRGFSEADFWAECQKIAGTSLTDLQAYSSTVKAIDYPTYFAYAGLHIDTLAQHLPGAWLGASVRQETDSLIVSEVIWDSPAWRAGIRQSMVLLAINGQKATVSAVEVLQRDKQAGDLVTVSIFQEGKPKEVAMRLGEKFERSFRITPLPKPNALQSAILRDWLPNAN